MIQEHGGNTIEYQNILDFSANINPLGMPETIQKTIIDNISSIEKYPDPFCTQLREKIAEREKISAVNIVCGNGADDLIYRIVHAVKPQKALMYSPCFSEYERALSEVGCNIIWYPLDENKEFELTETFTNCLDETIDICFICNPNNPNGRVIPPEILRIIAEKCSEHNILLVCDECFIDFVIDSEEYSIKNYLNEKCIILKAFTKIYAVPGIRLGYAVCGSRAEAEKIASTGQYWSVSSLAQRVGLTALDETKYIHRTVGLISRERRFLEAELKKAGVKTYHSDANFLLFKSSENLFAQMITEGILIRDCRNYRGLSAGYYRIAIRTNKENNILLNALRRSLNG